MRITFLDGQYRLAEQTIESDPEYIASVRERKESCREGERRCIRALFRDYREFALKRTLHRVYENSSFYRELFDKAGISPDEIRSFDDIPRLPFTFPDDLRGSSYDFLCMSERYVERPVSFYSSGTTGIRKRMFFSFKDTMRIKQFIGYAMNSIADTDDTRILSLMTNSNGRGASSVYVDAVRSLGMDAWTCSMENSSSDILKTSLEHDCNVWFGDIGTIYRTAKEIEYSGTDLASLGLKLLYVTMGNVSTHVRDYLEKSFGCEFITHYGLTEVGWGFAIEQPGLGGYYSNELDVYTEVVDPVTGAVLPDGETGELTYTIIGKEAMPLIRYRSGDLAWIRRAECEGQLDTIGLIKGRLEGVKTCPSGESVTPAMIEDVLYRFPEVIDYRLYDHGSFIEVQIEILPCMAASSADTVKAEETLKKRIAAELHELSGLRGLGPCKVEILPQGELKQYCYEKKRFIKTE